MRSFSIGSSCKLGALVLAATLLTACGLGHGSKPNTVNAANIPTAFDVTVIAEKDNQFEYDGAPLTSEDLKSAFRYRQEESLPMGTVLLKRGEKQKIKKEHIVAMARIAYEMKLRAFMAEKDGEITELVASAKEPEGDAPKPEHEHDRDRGKHGMEGKQ